MVNELQARYLCWQKLETEKLTRMTEIFETNNEPHKNAEITSLLSYHRSGTESTWEIRVVCGPVVS